MQDYNLLDYKQLVLEEVWLFVTVFKQRGTVSCENLAKEVHHTFGIEILGLLTNCNVVKLTLYYRVAAVWTYMSPGSANFKEWAWPDESAVLKKRDSC